MILVPGAQSPKSIQPPSAEPSTSVTLPFQKLLEAAGNEDKLAFFRTDGSRLETPSTTLWDSFRRGEEIDCDLAVLPETAETLGLSSLWYRLRNTPSQPGTVTLAPAGEVSHNLTLFDRDLSFPPLAVCDPLGRLASLTGAARSLLGYLTDEPLLGLSLEKLLGETGLLHREQVRSQQLEIPVDRRERQKLEIKTFPCLDLNGRASGWIVRFQSKPFMSPPLVNWQALIEHFPGIVMCLDREGKISFANRRVGIWTAEEVRGRDIFELVREDSRSTAAHFRSLVREQKSSLTGELPIYDPRTQETIWYCFSAVPLSYGDDVEVLVYATDVSLRIQAEQNLRVSQKRIRALSSRLDRAQEEERRRISRELHDELGGSLTALRLELGALGKVEGLPDSARDKLETIKTTLAFTLATVRRLSTQLRPQILDDLGLPAALESLLRDAARRCSLSYDFQVPRSLPGDAELHLHLYRICQEALTNICRHAQAKSVRLGITRPFRDRLDIFIKDDGKGFSPEEVATKATLGLSGMVERVQLLGGQLETRSAPNQGCRLYIQVPLTPALPHEEGV